MLLLCRIALIFVSLMLVLNLLTGAGAYINHERDLYTLSAVCSSYSMPTRCVYHKHEVMYYALGFINTLPSVNGIHTVVGME